MTFYLQVAVLSFLFLSLDDGLEIAEVHRKPERNSSANFGYGKFGNWAHKESTKIFRNGSDRACKDTVCSFGGVCVGGKCSCLEHFVGTHCERHANYCQKFSCLHKATCVPRLGGFTCVCPLIFTGIKCQTLKPERFETMQGQNFLYQPLLYVDVSTYFLFHASKVGDFPKVQITFGDGAKISSKKYQRLEKNPLEIILEHFYPPLFIETNSFYTFVFKHSYKKIGFYNIRVEAWNMFYKNFDTEYQVRVAQGTECNFDVSIKNISGIFHRRDFITIASSTKINCPGMKLHYEWNLYKIKDSNQYFYQKTFEPTLMLLPFSLDFGEYVAVLTTKSPINSTKKKTAKVYFEVKRMSITAEITGGDQIFYDAHKPIYIDGSKSFDPNYKKHKQPQLQYFWYYKMKGWKSFKNVNDTKEILQLNKMLTVNETYKFKLVVKNAHHDNNFGDFDGVDYQTVRVTTKAVPASKIVCIQNCFGRKINPNYPTVLSGICIFCPGGYTDVNSWSVYYDEGEKTATNANDVRFFKNNSTMVIKENVLKRGMRLKFVLSGKVNGDKTTPKSIVYLQTLTNPIIGQCSIEPKKGYGMLTTFTIKCENFKSNTKTKETLFYEVTQQTTICDSKINIFSAYSSTGTIANVILSPSLKIDEHLSVLSIGIFDVTGMYVTQKLNFTILHHLQYYKSVKKTTDIFTSFAVSCESNLGLLKSSGDYVILTQQIISACYSMRTFLNDTSSIDFETTNKPLVEYLYGLKLFGVKSIRHFLTAFCCVLKMPHQKYYFAVELLQKVMGWLEKLFYIEEEVIFEDDIHNIGVLMLESVFEIVKILHKYFHKDQEINTKITTLVSEIYKLMDVYLTYKATNEDFTLITVENASALLKISNIEYLSEEIFKITQKASVNIVPEIYLFHKNVVWTIKLVVFENLAKQDDGVLKFPVIFTNITNAVDRRPIKSDVFFEFKTNMAISKYVNGSILVDSSWKTSDESIKIYRFFVGKGEDALVKIDLRGDHELVVVLKKHIKPTMREFSNQKDTMFPAIAKKYASAEKGFSLFVQSEENYNSSVRIYYYVGILPHKRTLRKFNKIMKGAENTNETGFLKQGQKKPNGSSKNNNWTINFSILYTISVQTVECLSLASSNRWLKNCRATPKSTFGRITCKCNSTETSASMTALLKWVPVISVKNIEVDYVIPHWHNPLVLFLTLFFVIVFVGVFAWSVQKDKEESLRRSVCFLIDNNPNCDYSYLIIVYTGCRFGAGTTSKIVITLEGTLASSVPHLLNDTKMGVLRTNSQDFFVVKTAQPLGDIYRVHLWSDYSGATPEWFCDRVVVHDVQEHQVWYFVVKKWFTPLHDDVSMSFTVYNSSAYNSRYVLGESVKYELESGMHCWLGIFFKQPYNNFSRKQRVWVAFMHLLLIMCALMMINNKYRLNLPFSQIDSEGDFSFSPVDVGNGFLALLIALPCHLFFIWLFRCIKPPPQNTYNKTEPITNRYNLKKKTKKASHKTAKNNNINATSKRSLMRFSTTVQEANHGEASSAMNLMKPLTSLETTTTQSQNPNFSNDHTIRGKEIIVDPFCLPTYFLYVAWTILVVITTSCIFVEVFYGFAFGWVSSLHFLASFFCAFTLSFFVVEPTKLLIASYVAFANNKKQLMVEDRSDLVDKLDETYKIPENLIGDVEEKLKIWRQSVFYKPVWMGRTLKLHRNKMMEKKIKAMTTEMVIIIISFTVFLTMYKIFFDPLSYNNFKSIQTICDGVKQRKLYKLAFFEIKDGDDLVVYLNNTLISSLLPQKKSCLQPTIDGNNYLIGAIYLWKICPWNKNFDEKHEGKQWKYTDDVFAENNPFIFHENNKNDNNGGYVAVLRANFVREDFEYLVKNGWIDAFRTIHVDFVLFNHNLKHMSFTTLSFERSIEGGFNLNQNTQVIQMHFKTDLSEVFLVILFVIFVFYLIFYTFRKIPQSKHLRIVMVVYLFLTLTSFVVIFVERIKLFRISPFDTEKVDYGHFHEMFFWNSFLIDTLAFKSFFIVLNVLFFLGLFKKTRVFSTVLMKFVFEMAAFVVYFLWLLVSSAMLGLVLFHSHNPQFSDFLHSFYTVIFFSVRHYRNSDFDGDFSYTRLLYFWALFIAVFFVSRNIISVIFERSYSSTRKVSLGKSVNLEYCQLCRYSSNIIKNKQFKLSLKKSLVEYKMRAMGYLVAHFLSTNQSRKEEYKKKFMRFFVIHVLKHRFCELKANHDGDFESDVRKLENAKKIARIVILGSILSRKYERAENYEIKL